MRTLNQTESTASRNPTFKLDCSHKSCLSTRFHKLNWTWFPYWTSDLFMLVLRVCYVNNTMVPGRIRNARSCAERSSQAAERYCQRWLAICSIYQSFLVMYRVGVRVPIARNVFWIIIKLTTSMQCTAVSYRCQQYFGRQDLKKVTSTSLQHAKAGQPGEASFKGSAIVAVPVAHRFWQHLPPLAPPISHNETRWYEIQCNTLFLDTIRPTRTWYRGEVQSKINVYIVSTFNCVSVFNVRFPSVQNLKSCCCSAFHPQNTTLRYIH